MLKEVLFLFFVAVLVIAQEVNWYLLRLIELILCHRVISVRMRRVAWQPVAWAAPETIATSATNCTRIIQTPVPVWRISRRRTWTNCWQDWRTRKPAGEVHCQDWVPNRQTSSQPQQREWQPSGAVTSVTRWGKRRGMLANLCVVQHSDVLETCVLCVTRDTWPTQSHVHAFSFKYVFSICMIVNIYKR